MKGMLAILIAGGLLLASMVQIAAADDRGVNGFLIGAGGGAVLGQAIGRDTEGTLIGTAVGGMLGYMVGNELDKQAARPVLARTTGTIVIQPDRGRCRPGPRYGRRDRHHYRGRHDRVHEYRRWRPARRVVIREYERRPHRAGGPPHGRAWGHHKRRNQHWR